jgi:hypothetical protein
VRGEPEALRFKTGAAEEETGEDGEVLGGGNHVGIKGVVGGRVGRRYGRGAPAERTGSDRAARARPRSEAERSGRVEGGSGRPFLFPPSSFPPPPTLTIPSFVGERGGKAKMSGEGVSYGRKKDRTNMMRFLEVRMPRSAESER